MTNPTSFDRFMRQYENYDDRSILPGMYFIVRLDGRGFTKLTKQLNFTKPFDEIFRDYMVNTTQFLVAESGFKIDYAFTESDEISLYINPQTDLFDRKTRKFISILAGEASGYLSYALGFPVSFDARVSQLPNQELVIDYFRWRQADADRNALSGWAYWTLRDLGLSGTQAARELNHASKADKNEILHNHDLNYADVPSWQKNGIGVYTETYQKVGFNPLKQEAVTVDRKRLKVNYELPYGDAYSSFLTYLLF